jgi:hypothetical protein
LAVVYIWTLIAMIIRQRAYQSLVINCVVCIVITLAAIVAITMKSLKENKDGTLKKGLFYKVEM